MAIGEEPILSRLDRLDNLLKQLEEIRGCSRSSPKSSCASTPSSGTLASEGQASWADFSPKSLEKHCRPISYVMMETEAKGSLIERIDHVEGRVFKLCVQLEEELEAERSKEEAGETEKKAHKKGLKGLVKKVVKASSRKHKPNDQ
ncbi:hypothetical protein Tsubulata_002291 [Turnera subulata]|uniref:Uncharacterized protein n=1 Tax=Turnera subulata TaxID=218843 RepID=A0A9Q0FXW0_9ROSI|nr:hypothetical protein Tsubulata_002291 [Turnera subulata]